MAVVDDQHGADGGDDGASVQFLWENPGDQGEEVVHHPHVSHDDQHGSTGNHVMYERDHEQTETPMEEALKSLTLQVKQMSVSLNQQRDVQKMILAVVQNIEKLTIVEQKTSIPSGLNPEGFQRPPVSRQVGKSGPKQTNNDVYRPTFGPPEPKYCSATLVLEPGLDDDPLIHMDSRTLKNKGIALDLPGKTSTKVNPSKKRGYDKSMGLDETYVGPSTDFRRERAYEPMNQGEDGHASVDCLVGRMLNFVPSPNQTPLKMPRFDPINHSPGTQYKPVGTSLPAWTPTAARGKTDPRIALARKSKPRGHIVPAAIKTKFKPTSDMQLSMEQAQISAYLFSPEKDEREVVFKVGSVSSERRHFDCFCPGKMVTEDVLKMMALQITSNQQNGPMKTVWALPPSFEEQVTQGQTIDQLLKTYSEEFMHPFTNLEHIYVPIDELGAHWYLMVISVKDMKIYHLDSHLKVVLINSRHDTIRTIACTLSEMIQTEGYPEDFLNGRTNFGTWEICEARGIPNTGSSDNSALWVTSWMKMEHSFHPNVVGVLNDRIVRMKAALGLVMGDHNECYSELRLNADNHWRRRLFTSTA